MTAPVPRRDNGLNAPSYTRVEDVPTHLVEGLLERLRDAGVAAYSAPSTGRLGPYGETVPPPGPSDSVYVDAAVRDRARSVLALYLRETNDELAWSDIVAGFDREPEDVVPRWPVSEDVDDDTERDDNRGSRRTAVDSAEPTVGPTIGFDALRDQVASAPLARPEREDPDEHFKPPPPPPLPSIDRISRFAWAGALGGPLVLVLATILGISLDGWVGLLAVFAFMAGFVTLVARMKDRPPNDTGPDDGAVV